MREADPPLPTVPSTIAEEKLLNPFMRVLYQPASQFSADRLIVWSQVGEDSVQKHAGQSDPVETMRALRAEKDNFKKKWFLQRI